jgi:hypothetical protein
MKNFTVDFFKIFIFVKASDNNQNSIRDQEVTEEHGIKRICPSYLNEIANQSYIDISKKQRIERNNFDQTPFNLLMYIPYAEYKQKSQNHNESYNLIFNFLANLIYFRDQIKTFVEKLLTISQEDRHLYVVKLLDIAPEIDQNKIKFKRLGDIKIAVRRIKYKIKEIKKKIKANISNIQIENELQIIKTNTMKLEKLKNERKKHQICSFNKISIFYTKKLKFQFKKNMNGIGLFSFFNSLYKLSKYFDCNVNLQRKFIEHLPLPADHFFDIVYSNPNAVDNYFIYFILEWLIHYQYYFDLIKNDQTGEFIGKIDFCPTSKLVHVLIKVFEFINYSFDYSPFQIEFAKNNLIKMKFLEALKTFYLKIKEPDTLEIIIFNGFCSSLDRSFFNKLQKCQSGFPISGDVYSNLHLLYIKISQSFLPYGSIQV